MYDYIEVQSAALAAIRRTTDDVARLAAIVAEMRRNLHIPDAYVELDVAFHRLIASMTRNAMIYHLVGALRDAIKNMLNESLLRQQTESPPVYGRSGSIRHSIVTPVATIARW